MGELIFKEECYEIIGVCMDVHKELRNGYLEIIYKDAIEIEFKRLGIPYVREKEFHVFFKGQPLQRTFNVDFFVYNKINLESKIHEIPEAISVSADRKSTRLNSSHSRRSRMPSSA